MEKSAALATFIGIIILGTLVISGIANYKKQKKESVFRIVFEIINEPRNAHCTYDIHMKIKGKCRINSPNG